jgi:hypothetical protein
VIAVFDRIGDWVKQIVNLASLSPEISKQKKILCRAVDKLTKADSCLKLLIKI